MNDVEKIVLAPNFIRVNHKKP